MVYTNIFGTKRETSHSGNNYFMDGCVGDISRWTSFF